MQIKYIYPPLFILLFVVVAMTACSKENDIPEDRRLIITQEELEERKQEQQDSLMSTISFSQNEFKGMTLFMQHCNKCHPGGDEGEGPSLIDKKRLPDMLIHFQIRTGMGDMPAFDKDILSKDDVKNIISFIQLMREDVGNN